VKKNISKKHDKSDKAFNRVREEFTGKNLTRFGGSGLIRRFFERHRIKYQIENRITVEGRRKSKYNIGDMLISSL
jgi:hypothetical protein